MHKHYFVQNIIKQSVLNPDFCLSIFIQQTGTDSFCKKFADEILNVVKETQAWSQTLYTWKKDAAEC